jgi:hypothetical protein
LEHQFTQDRQDKELLGLCQKSVLRDDQGKKEQLWNMTGIGIEQTEVDTSRMTHFSFITRAVVVAFQG